MTTDRLIEIYHSIFVCLLYALNYDRWSICSNSCDQIGADKIQLYKFVKAALIRKFGEGFYEQLEYLDGLASTKEISLDDIGDELE